MLAPPPRRAALAVLIAASLSLIASSSGGLETEPAAGQDRATRAETLRFPFPQDEGALTPTTFELGYPLVTLVYDTLMWRDESGKPRPWLVRSVHKGEGGRLIMLHLREGVRWHDGRPLTAADVAFTFRFFARRPHPRFTPQLASVERAEVVDRLAVVITLRHPSPGFMDQPLADLPILPRHLWEDLPDSRQAPAGLPVGSGPYRLVEHRRGRLYRFRANRRYFLGRPRVKTIEVPIERDFDRTLRDLQNRRIDMIPASLSEGAVARLDRTAFKVARGPLYRGTVLMFNTRKPPFNRPAARRAVARAIDIRRLARILGREAAVAADHGYVAPDSPRATDGSTHRFDQRAARSSLRRLKLPNLRVLASESDPQRRESGRQVVLALKRAGVSAELVELPQSELASAVGENGATPRFEAAIWTTPPLASYDPDYLSVVFGSDPDRAVLNYSGYDEPGFDDLAGRVAEEGNDRKRARLVRSELELLARDLPVVPLVYATGAFAYRPAVYDGWRFIDGTGILDKQSFLPASGLPANRRPDTAAAPPSPGGGLGPAGYVALALLAVTLALAAAGLLGAAGRKLHRGRR